MFEEQGAADIQTAVAEYAGQAEHAEWAVGQLQLIALGQAVQIRCGGCVLNPYLPKLAVACAVELTRLAECRQLFGRAFNTRTFFAD